MSVDLILRENYGEFFTRNIVLDGIPATDVTPPVKGDVFWRWEDEPTMEPRYLGSGNANTSVIIPFDLKGRTIRLFVVSKTDANQQTTVDLKQAIQTTFTVGGPAVLTDAAFSAGVTALTIANNGGTGDIHIQRRTGSDDFATVATVSSATTSHNDSPPINGTYDYQLTQDGQDGTSNMKTIVATGIGSGSGSTPDTLDGSFDSVDTVNLTWVNHSGTGSNIIERKTSLGGSWVEIGSVSSGTAAFNDVVDTAPYTRVYYYRVRNESAAGYSNFLQVIIAAA